MKTLNDQPPQFDPRIVDAIASVAHAVNDSYRAAIGEQQKGPWERQSIPVKQGTSQGVVNHLMNPGSIDPSQSHDLWLEHKLRQGWRYGEEEDVENKVHPCLLPYHALPESQRVKDYLFGAVVSSLGPLLITKATVAKDPERADALKATGPAVHAGGLRAGLGRIEARQAAAKTQPNQQEASEAHGSS